MSFSVGMSATDRVYRSAVRRAHDSHGEHDKDAVFTVCGVITVLS
jgi:hypothetical protein